MNSLKNEFFLSAEFVSVLQTRGSQFVDVWPVVHDITSDEIFTDMTICVRTKIVAFPRLAEVNMFMLGSEEEGFVWFLGIFQPLSGMSDLGKQVFLVRRFL